MNAKILVTGGAGYIGSILVQELLNSNFEVTVLDNFMYKQSSLNNICHLKNFNIVKGDIRIKDNIVPLLKKHDIIIPLAALVGAPICKQDPVGAQNTNVDAITMMLKNISKSQVIIMPTTNSAYGSGGDNNFCTEESELKPISKYAIDKVEIEKKLLDFENVISFRLATVFGMSPRMRLDLLVNDFTYRAVHDKFIILFESNFKRNYIHVRDVSRVFIHGIHNVSKMKGEIFNVGLSEANISKHELCKLIKNHLPDFTFIEAPVGKDPDQRNYIVSNTKIEKTGFSTLFGLNDGIVELIKGFQMLKNNKYSNV
jgi:nucleoside-diphosphate-sugar epimerase